jgi:hypothetical protein
LGNISESYLPIGIHTVVAYAWVLGDGRQSEVRQYLVCWNAVLVRRPVHAQVPQAFLYLS